MWILDINAEQGVLAEYIVKHEVYEWNVGAGEGWPTMVSGAYAKLHALQADLDANGYTTQLRKRG